jgi:ABC-type amino acid transport substrate-binding protein
MLPNALGRPVKLKTYTWDTLIEALLYREIDLIMSGMTVTRARQVRIAFTDPYLETGLMTAFRLKDIKKYSSTNKIMKSNSSVGVVGNTTGEAFVRKNFPYASRIIVLHQASDAAWELKGRTIDLFVHDAPSIMWLVSENESDITGLWEPLDSDMLAWGIRKDDLELRNSLNAVLKKWKEDGTLDRILDRWLPFRS